MYRGTTTILMGAMVVSAAWAGLTHEPEAPRQPYPLPRTESVASARWAEQAEQAFGLDRGFGVRAMTEREWKEHQRKMATMRPDERVRYQQEVRSQIAERMKGKSA
jgi:hypothetical protein